nr:FAD-dependent monooxygenase [Actinomycetota bacterium]
ALDDAGASVVARVGEQDVTAHYVIGCDGYRSTVRKLLEIPFEGESLPETVWMADARIDWDVPADHVWQLLHRDGPMSAIPMPCGQWRVATLKAVDAPAPTPEFFAAALAKRHRRNRDALDISWMSEFRVSCRLAAQYGRGRVLLAGDAAHVHSPIGGQGLNVGMQDAFDLANRLSLDLSTSPTDLVASYEAARRPVAHSVIRTNARITKLAMASQPVPRFLGNHVLPNVLRLTAPARRAGLKASGLAAPAQRSPRRRAAGATIAR